MAMAESMAESMVKGIIIAMTESIIITWSIIITLPLHEAWLWLESMRYYINKVLLYGAMF